MSNINLPPEVEIKDNFLPHDEWIYVSTWFINHCQWLYRPVCVNKNDHSDDFQFVHVFWDPTKGTVSNSISVISIMMQMIDPRAWLKIKANLRMKSDKVRITQMHNDFDNLTESTTSIYYLNTNNGGTYFENGSRVQSKENRLVTFPTNLKHAGSSSSDTKERIVLNFNYIKK